MSGWAEIGDERSHTVFLIMYAVQRLLRTYWEGMKLDGEIIAAHSLWLIVTAFVLFDLSTSGIVTSLIGHRFAKPIMLTLVSFGGVTDSEFET